MLRKRLRSGFTTGACAAAAAKAATLILLSEKFRDIAGIPRQVDIPFPDGSRVGFTIHGSGLKTDGAAWASVIKEAGDDPDVTNGAEIIAEAALLPPNHSSLITHHSSLVIKGGKGVGVITKPGLPVGIGEPAINPIPRRMIVEAVMEALSPGVEASGIEITISVTRGEELAKKTLNSRLGITGGISILGTTGVVRPISADAWTATISASMNVAKAMGCGSIVLSAGRASEKAHMKKFAFPDESYVMMGDYLEFALLDAARHGFNSIHLCAQWAKMLKIAMATPGKVADFAGYTTHVRHGAIVMKKALELLRSLGAKIPAKTPDGPEFNTAREIFDFINSSCITRHPSLLSDVCSGAKRYAEAIAAGVQVTAHLVSYGGDIIAGSK